MSSQPAPYGDDDAPPLDVPRRRGRTEPPPPHDLDAEEALLGAMLLGPEAIESGQKITSAEAFYNPGNGLVFGAICRLAGRCERADPVTVAAELSRLGRLEEAGGAGRLLALQSCPCTGAAPGYAATIAECHDRRTGMAKAKRLYEALSDRARDLGEAAAMAEEIGVSTRPRSAPGQPAGDPEAVALAATSALRLHRGGAFLLDAPATPPALWGSEGQVLWAEGESLILCGPAGVGKTTLAAQLLVARLGLRPGVLGFPVEAGAAKTLYLACDRPAQIRRALGRLVSEEDREVLDERLVAWAGPPPRDLAGMPELLLHLAREAGADTVVLDSLKDVALGLSDDAVGAGLNRAMQLCVAEGVQVLALHHQRKGQNGTKPRTLEDLYGSTWIAAGAGSVVLLWGQAGDPIVEFIHLKQPAEEVGPLQVEHDHHAGTSTVSRGFDPLRFLRLRAGGANTMDVARAMFEKQDPTEAQRAKAKRQLDRLVRQGHAKALTEGQRGGAGGTAPTTYVALDTERQEPAE